MNGILGQKVGMTSVFDETGRQIPVTVISTAGNVVVDKRTNERDGYTALVIGFGERTTKGVSKPLLGFHEKQGQVEDRDGKRYVKRHLREFRVSEEALDAVNIGDEVPACSSRVGYAM